MKKQITFKLLTLACAMIVFSLFSCKKDKPPVKDPVTPLPPVTQRALIVNEGTFNGGNASISFYDAISGNVVEDYYASQNSEASLGDVAQSMVKHGDELFIVVNNSGKIVVCDQDLKKKAEITGFASPRYIEPVGAELAYVSDLYSGNISVVNLATRSIVQTIALPGFTEMMLHKDGKVFVCNVNSDKLYVISTASHEVTDSIFVGTGAASITADKNGKLWVLAGGDYNGTEAPRLSRINAGSHAVEESFEFVKGQFPSRLCADADADSLFFLLNGVNCLGINATALPSAPLIAAGSANFYALEIDKNSGYIYVSDVIDYMQRASIFVYDVKGEKKKEFEAGVMATDFFFE